MLKITGPAQSFCDGLSRRRFVEIGALGAFGLSLPRVLRNEAHAAAIGTAR